MQFSNAFWMTLQRFQSNSHVIDQLFSRADLTLEVVLSEDAIIQETRNNNSKLIDFFTHENLRSLISLITVYPEPDADKKRTENHPFVASELLSDGNQLHEKISESTELLSYFFEFLNTEKPDATLLGYFCKAVNGLLARCSEKVIIFLQSSDYIFKLVNHIYSRGVFDISLKILCALNSDVSEVLLSQKSLLKSLVQKLGTGSKSEALNSGLVIVEYLSKMSDIMPRELTEVISSEETIQVLFDCLQSSEEFRVVHSVNVLKALLQTNLKLNMKMIIERYFNGEVFDKNLSCLVGILNRKKEKTLVNCIKKKYEPLGQDRLKVIELVTVLLKIPDENILNSLVESKIFHVIFELFFRYTWNSFLHSACDSLFTSILSRNNENAVKDFILSPEFLNNIINSANTAEGNHRIGNLGVIHKIANQIKNSEHPVIIENLTQHPEWKQYLAKYLDKRNKTDQYQLGDLYKKIESVSSEDGFEPLEQNNQSNNEVKPEDPDTQQHPDSEKGEVKNLEIEIDESEQPFTVKALDKNSPLAKRRHSGGIHSPSGHPDYNEINFWKIQVLVDELDGLEGLE